MGKKYILALDQGTTSSRAIIFDKEGNAVKTAQKEFTQIYPRPGWVEHDPVEIWATQSGVAREVIEAAGISASEIAAIGITNQRETTVVWDKTTGYPIYNAIVWQCRRTASRCDQLKEKGLEDYIRNTTGLVVDAYFSGTKIEWILDNVEGAREKAQRGELAFGTVDSWLVWNLTRGKLHITDYSNASRTMLFDIDSLKWDGQMLSELNIPRSMMPEVVSSSKVYGLTDKSLFGEEIPIASMAGDQQASLFGHTCFNKGDVKNTYGTGCFMLMQTGTSKVTSENGLLTTIAWEIDGKVEYALEGSVFIGGALIQWLRDEMNLIDDSEDSEYHANKVNDNGGVYVVPAFAGLGAPYWDMYARGTIVGLTRGTGKNHIIRASLESIAYQSMDVLDLMQTESGVMPRSIKVDGGATGNSFLMQFQSDISGLDVYKPKIAETTALGAAFMAGLAVSFWKSKDELQSIWKLDRSFTPQMKSNERERNFKGWKRAVERSRRWVETDEA